MLTICSLTVTFGHPAGRVRRAPGGPPRLFGRDAAETLALLNQVSHPHGSGVDRRLPRPRHAQGRAMVQMGARGFYRASGIPTARDVACPGRESLRPGPPLERARSEGSRGIREGPFLAHRELGEGESRVVFVEGPAPQLRPHSSAPATSSRLGSGCRAPKTAWPARDDPAERHGDQRGLRGLGGNVGRPQRSARWAQPCSAPGEATRRLLRSG